MSRIDVCAGNGAARGSAFSSGGDQQTVLEAEEAFAFVIGKWARACAQYAVNYSVRVPTEGHVDVADTGDDDESV